MKRLKKSFLVISLAFLMTFQVIFTSILSSNGLLSMLLYNHQEQIKIADNQNEKVEIISDVDALSSSSGSYNNEEDILSTWDVVDGVLGVLFILARFIVILVGAVFHIITVAVTGNGNPFIGIFFYQTDANKSSTMLSTNFFSEKGGTIHGVTGVWTGMRTLIAKWYFILRNLAIIFLIIILIYVGIRMAIATTGKDKSKYKKMLVNWVTSLGLLIVMHFIMILFNELNDKLVGIMSQILSNSYESAMSSVSIGNIAKLMILPSFVVRNDSCNCVFIIYSYGPIIYTSVY